MKRSLEQGFTLVELMVVVAIIGILSAVAIPNFKKYQAKSKTTEAKMQLASIYSYELTSASEYDSFAACLNALGYDPAPKGYYAVGFRAHGGSNPQNIVSSNGLPGCVAAAAVGVTGFLPTSLKSYSVAVTTANIPATTDVDQDSFTAGAAGNLDGAQIDQWTIDHTKNLLQTNVGY